ncbi:MAG: type II toxin-antitoxin system RelE/ParE family toxin [Chromatiales bacterium]
MYKLEFTASALSDFGYFKKAEQTFALDNIEASLRHESLAETRRRKPLRPNDLSAWELRVGDFRVFYDVEEDEKVLLNQGGGFQKTQRALYPRSEV